MENNSENTYTFTLSDSQKDLNPATETNVEQATEVSILEVPIDIVEETEVDFEGKQVIKHKTAKEKSLHE